MAARIRRTTQPAAVAGVDWGNPITRALVTAFSAGGGTNPVDAVNSRPWARQYGDDYQLAPSLDGYALVNGASVNYKVTSPNNMVATAGQTVVLVVTPLASITVENQIAIADNAGWYAGTLYVGDGTNARFAAGGWSGSAQRATAPTDYVLRRRYVVASRVNASGTLDLFIDGVLVASNSATIGNLSYSRLLIVRSPSNTAKAIAFAGAAGFSRALSDLEIKSLTDDFWQLFSPVAKRVWAPAAASGNAAITQADGTSTTSSIGGSSTAAATPTGAAGTSTAASIAASATAAAALTQANGASTASTLTASATAASAVTQAAGTSTAATLTGAGLTAGASSITAADGTSTAATLAGSSVAAGAIAQANGVTTTATLAGSDGITIAAAGITAASGASTAATFAASAVAATVVIAAAGASSASLLASNAPQVIAGATVGRRMAVTGARPDRLQTAGRPARL